MAKIDFDSDSAPFSGSVLPTIDDVAALAVTEGRTEIEPNPRAGEGWARKSQAMLLPVAIILGAIVLGFFHMMSVAQNPDSGEQVTFQKIPAGNAKDVRVIQRVPERDSVLFCSSLAKDGKKVVFFHEKNSKLDPSWPTDGVDFYGVSGSAIGAEGVLLDGYRWYPLPP